MTGRLRLPNRRRSEILSFVHEGNQFTLGLSRFHDGRVAEIFISSSRPGSSIEAIARDAAILASLAFQHGCPLATLRGGLTRDHGGAPATLLGAALDMLAEGGR
jgi:ribonucleoside-diphosphate reductase alpha chain